MLSFSLALSTEARYSGFQRKVQFVRRVIVSLNGWCRHLQANESYVLHVDRNAGTYVLTRNLRLIGPDPSNFRACENYTDPTRRTNFSLSLARSFSLALLVYPPLSASSLPFLALSFSRVPSPHPTARWKWRKIVLPAQAALYRDVDTTKSGCQ